MSIEERYLWTVAECARRIDAQTILDVGGGSTCGVAGVLAPQVNLVALDVSREGLASNPVKSRCVADATRPLPFADGSIDMIVSRSALEHLPDVEAFIREASRVLRPGGVMVHLFPCRWAPFAIVNRILPSWITSRLIQWTGIAAGEALGFRAYYDHCTPWQFEWLLWGQGFIVFKHELSYNSAHYVKWCRPLYLAYRLYERVCQALRLRGLCSYCLSVSRVPTP